MATYLPGITDYIPQIQPFKPDFNTFNNILQINIFMDIFNTQFHGVIDIHDAA